jgi:hypothetical protein
MPTAAILVGQSAKTRSGSGKPDYDAGEKIGGPMLHMLVDCLGLLLAVAFRRADVQDRDGAKLFVEEGRDLLPSLRLICADGAYAGGFDRVGADYLRLAPADGAPTGGSQRLYPVAPPLGGRPHLRLVAPVPPGRQGLWVFKPNCQICHCTPRPSARPSVNRFRALLGSSAVA